MRVLAVANPRQAAVLAQTLQADPHVDFQLQVCHTVLDAYEALAAQEFVAVVVDLDEEAGDGLAVLQCARRVQSVAQRIFVGTPPEGEAAAADFGVAHQAYVRPCDASTLYVAIRQAVRLGQRVTRPGLRRIAAQIESLPSLPTIYGLLLAELRRSDASIRRVAELLAQDLAMSAKVLQLVNSPYFGLVSEVRDVQHAATLLGLDALQSLVLAAGVFRELEGLNVPASLLERLLEHSLAVAAVARSIAHDVGISAAGADHAFLGGVLHDVGKLLLADRYGRDYFLVRAAAAHAHFPLSAAETDQFDANHAELGGYLLCLWGLPQPIVEAVAFHHDPLAAFQPAPGPLLCVHAANALVRCAEEQADDETSCSGTDWGQLSLPLVESLGLGHLLPRWQTVAAARAIGAVAAR